MRFLSAGVSYERISWVGKEQLPETLRGASTQWASERSLAGAAGVSGSPQPLTWKAWPLSKAVGEKRSMPAGYRYICSSVCGCGNGRDACAIGWRLMES